MDEYISKQDMLNAVEKLDIIPSVDGMGNPTNAEDFRVQFLGTVLKVEPADVVPVVHAYWRDTGSGQECSACKEIQYGYDTGRHYCANCGAKMDAQGEE